MLPLSLSERPLNVLFDSVGISETKLPFQTKQPANVSDPGSIDYMPSALWA
jgi:hypothetical protein